MAESVTSMLGYCFWNSLTTPVRASFHSGWVLRSSTVALRSLLTAGGAPAAGLASAAGLAASAGFAASAGLVAAGWAAGAAAWVAGAAAGLLSDGAGGGAPPHGRAHRRA